MTIFEKIASRQIPADIVFEAEDFLAFRDIHPQAPVHVLIIPKRCIPRIAEAQAADADLLGRMLAAVPEIARGVPGQGAADQRRLPLAGSRAAPRRFREVLDRQRIDRGRWGCE